MTVLSAAHTQAGSGITAYVAKIPAQLILVIHDLAQHQQPPSGATALFAAAAVAGLVFLWAALGRNRS